MSVSILSLDDEQIASLICGATRSVLFIGPRVSLPLAQAISARWIEMGSEAIQVLLDTDPEICRLGYGTIEGLRLLQETAAKLNCRVHHHPGIRIGVLIWDDKTVVFAPSPLLIEGGSTQFSHPNAIQLTPDGSHGIGLSQSSVQREAQTAALSWQDTHLPNTCRCLCRRRP